MARAWQALSVEIASSVVDRVERLALFLVISAQSIVVRSIDRTQGNFLFVKMSLAVFMMSNTRKETNQMSA